MFDCVMPILLKSWKTIAKTGMKATTAIKLHWAIPEKQTNRGAGGWGGSEQGISNFLGRGIEERAYRNSWAKLKGSGISKGVHQKFLLNFHGSWFLTFEIRRGVTKLCIISRVRACFLWNF